MEPSGTLSPGRAVPRVAHTDLPPHPRPGAVPTQHPSEHGMGPALLAPALPPTGRVRKPRPPRWGRPRGQGGSLTRAPTIVSSVLSRAWLGQDVPREEQLSTRTCGPRGGATGPGATVWLSQAICPGRSQGYRPGVTGHPADTGPCPGTSTVFRAGCSLHRGGQGQGGSQHPQCPGRPPETPEWPAVRENAGPFLPTASSAESPGSRRCVHGLSWGPLMVTTRDWPQEGTWEKRGSAGLPPPTWGHGQRGRSPDGAGLQRGGAGGGFGRGALPLPHAACFPHSSGRGAGADGRRCQPLTTSPRPGSWWSSSASRLGSSASR